MNTLGLTNAEVSSVAILGAGAVGGFLAAVLWKRGVPTTCIAKPDSAISISREGIHLESSRFGNLTAHPGVVTRLEYEPDLLFIATKAPSLVDALRRVPSDSVTNTVIIPLLNGIEHVHIIRDSLGRHVAVGMISIEVMRPEPCHVIHSSPHVRIELASDRDVPESKLETIARLLSETGIETHILDREADVIWRKLVRLNAIASTTAATQSPVGFVRTDPWWRKKLESCACEAARVAEAEGVEISPETVMNQIDTLPADLSTSLQRDIAKGLPSELDAILGDILRLAGKRGIQCPTIQELFAMIKDRSKA